MKFTEITEAPIVPGAVSTTAPATGTQPVSTISQDPQAQQKMMAQQALDRANKKKEIQDQIREKQKELADLQKQLSELR